jgi:hypothetical protein
MEDEPLGAWLLVVTGAGASSSSENGFNEQPANVADIASKLKRTRRFLRFLLEDIIDGCSIAIIRACPSASVAIICRVGVYQAAKHVTIPAQKAPMTTLNFSGIVRYLIQ